MNYHSDSKPNCWEAATLGWKGSQKQPGFDSSVSDRSLPPCLRLSPLLAAHRYHMCNPGLKVPAKTARLVKTKMYLNHTGCRLPAKRELCCSQRGWSIYPPLLTIDVCPKALARPLWSERTYQCHQTQASSSQLWQHRHRNSWRRSQQQASNLPCLHVKVVVQWKLLKTALPIWSKWERKRRVTPWFIAATRKAGVFRTSGLHPRPKTGSVISCQLGRCLCSLTLTYPCVASCHRDFTPSQLAFPGAPTSFPGKNCSQHLT